MSFRALIKTYWEKRMDYKNKSRLMLGVVFILGAVLGYLTKDLVTKSPYDQIRLLRSKGGIVHRFEDALNLTEAQKKELRPILENHEKKIMGVAEKSREEIREIIDSFKVELKPYLSEKQIKLLTDEFNFRIPFPGHPEGRANFLKDKLNLSEAQFEKVKEIYLKENDKIKEIRPEFPDEDRKSFEQMKRIFEETESEILKILDENQKEVFKKIEDERGKGVGFIIRGESEKED
jgi:hypothetical protein